jgi:hypothetical protein
MLAPLLASLVAAAAAAAAAAAGKPTSPPSPQQQQPGQTVVPRVELLGVGVRGWQGMRPRSGLPTNSRLVDWQAKARAVHAAIWSDYGRAAGLLRTQVPLHSRWFNGTGFGIPDYVGDGRYGNGPSAAIPVIGSVRPSSGRFDNGRGQYAWCCPGPSPTLCTAESDSSLTRGVGCMAARPAAHRCCLPRCSGSHCPTRHCSPASARTSL